jgi:hypothetical protein
MRVKRVVIGGADLDDARTHEGGNEEWRAGEARRRKDE